MKKLVTATAIVVSALCLFGASRLEQPSNTYTLHHENVLGTSMEIRLNAESPAAAARAEAATLAEIDRLGRILSSYDSKSEFSRWMRTTGQPVAVSEELREVLTLWDRYRALTGGALNPAAEAVNRVWKHAAKQNRMPSAQELTAAVRIAGGKHWSLGAGTATHLSAAPLAMNSFVKSYILAKANAAALAAGGVTSAMVNIGGDIVTGGKSEQTLQIADPVAKADNAAPMAQIAVRNRAVATSGNYKRGVQIGGQHYSHIVDPRTGSTADQIVSTTVVASNAVDAGALATAFSVMTPEESKRVAALIPGVEYMLVDRNGHRITSAGWSRMETAPFKPVQLAAAMPRPGLLAAQGQAGGAWNAGFELNITLALAQIEGQRTRRPYVAVWIEDKDKFPLRTIALWYNKDRWLPELKAWTRDERVRSLAEGTDISGTVASATRPPGKYNFKWDGKDNAGKPVKPGKYTVMIEASREHGTYQVMHQEMDFTGTPKQIQIPGNTEIESATLDYRKATR